MVTTDAPCPSAALKQEQRACEPRLRGISRHELRSWLPVARPQAAIRFPPKLCKGSWRPRAWQPRTRRMAAAAVCVPLLPSEESSQGGRQTPGAHAATVPEASRRNHGRGPAAREHLYRSTSILKWPVA